VVTDDTLQVLEELKLLRNFHYNDRPVSIYGGMVDLPLVVTRVNDRRFFNTDEREVLTEGALCAEFDAEAGAGIGAMERELRENRFGDALWGALENILSRAGPLRVGNSLSECDGRDAWRLRGAIGALGRPAIWSAHRALRRSTLDFQSLRRAYRRNTLGRSSNAHCTAL
jgi:hypothetical protein